MKRIGIILVTLVFVFPTYWMIQGSFQDIGGIMALPPRWIPRTVTLVNYNIILQNNPVLLWIGNSAIIATATVIGSVLMSSMAGYAFSVYRFRGREVLFWAFLAALMIPRQIMFIPLFKVTYWLQIPGTRLAVILPMLFSPFHIFLFRRYCDRLPPDFVDSARIDGAGEFAILTRVIMPLCAPMLAALSIFVCVGVLGDLLWQLLVLQESTRKTLLVGIVNATYHWSPPRAANPIGRILAGGVILAVPVLALYFRFQRYFVTGLQIGGVKE